MTQPAHEWMLEIIQAAEELGYQIRYVGKDTIGLTAPDAGHFVDIDISGTYVNGAALRRLLAPAREGTPHV